MKENEPQAWADAVKVDYALREGVRGTKKGYKMYVHRSLTPLDKVEFQDGQGDWLDAWGNECEGMCGV